MADVSDLAKSLVPPGNEYAEVLILLVAELQQKKGSANPTPRTN
jgi:hypothetical protein